MSRDLAGDVDYEAHGQTYSTVRRADPRIETQVLAALGPGRSVLNVGAGTGSYEPTDRYVAAVEPSPTMRSQRPATAAPAIDATAEALPFDDDSFDAAMATITVHQWHDLDQGLRELRRVSRDRVVILTFDNTAADRFWLAAYAPELIATEQRRDPTIEHLAAVLGGRCEIQDVDIPLDCTDGFTEAFYGRPERFLDPAVRASQSVWGFIQPEATARIIDDLERDLGNGTWDRQHGHLRTQPTFHGSLRLLIAQPWRAGANLGAPPGARIAGSLRAWI